MEEFERLRKHMEEVLSGFVGPVPEEIKYFVERQRETQRLLEELHNMFAATIDNLHEALCARDPSMGEHCGRTASLAEDLGRHLGMDEDGLKELRTAALLHDYGIIGVRQVVLTQPIAFEETHPVEYQTHAVSGFLVLRSCRHLPATVVRHHHENWDGTGYPDGLVGEAILYEARIVAVANVFDRLTRGPYVRRIFEEGEALEFLKEKAGVMFDPEVVAAFIEIRS